MLYYLFGTTFSLSLDLSFANCASASLTSSIPICTSLSAFFSKFCIEISYCFLVGIFSSSTIYSYIPTRSIVSFIFSIIFSVFIVLCVLLISFTLSQVSYKSCSCKTICIALTKSWVDS